MACASAMRSSRADDVEVRGPAGYEGRRGCFPPAPRRGSFGSGPLLDATRHQRSAPLVRVHSPVTAAHATHLAPCLSPRGHLSLAPAPDAPPLDPALADWLRRAFERGAGHGLLHCVGQEP